MHGQSNLSSDSCLRIQGELGVLEGDGAKRWSGGLGNDVF